MIRFFIVSAFFITLSSSLFADPPNRVARLSLIEGSVTLLPGGETEWIYAQLNRPFITGDRFWVNDESRSELQVGGAAIRIRANTDLSLFTIDNNLVQLGLNTGTINLHIWRMQPNQSFEVDTPNLVFTTNQPGDYRIEVDAEHDITTVSVRYGSATVSTEEKSYLISEQQSFSAAGTDLAEYEYTELAPNDDFDEWCISRDKRRSIAKTSQYVSDEVIGYEDLDTYGAWQTDATYGNIWIPNNVSADWVPYSQGSWLWQDPWGWTWVDDLAWGFAPFHYGRWVIISGHWAWIPGPINIEPVYAPALVVFFGGDNFQIGFSANDYTNGIGWLPLGPGDAYIPPYVVTQNYFTQINISNTIINNTYINNLYKNPHEKMNYHNLKPGNPILAIPTKSFIRGEKIPKTARMPWSKELMSKGQIKHRPNLNPIPESVIGGAPRARFKPPREDRIKPVLVKTTPSPIVTTPLGVSKPSQPLLRRNEGVYKKIDVKTSPVIPGRRKDTFKVRPVERNVDQPGMIQPSTIPQPPSDQIRVKPRPQGQSGLEQQPQRRIQPRQVQPLPTLQQPVPQPQESPRLRERRERLQQQRQLQNLERQPIQQPQQLRSIQQPQQPLRTIPQPQHQLRTIQQPQQPRMIQQLHQPRTIQHPQQPRMIQQPQQPRMIQQLHQPRTIQHPQQPRMIQQPQQPSIIQQPQQPRIIQQPQQPRIIQQPQQPRIIQQPQQPRIIQQPQQPRIIQQPQQPRIIQQPQQPRIIQQPQQPRIIQQPQQPRIIQQPQQPRIIRQPQQPVIQKRKEDQRP